MTLSVFDVLDKEVREWLEVTKSALLQGQCRDWDEYLRASERMKTAERLLEIVKDALKRLEESQNE